MIADVPDAMVPALGWRGWYVVDGRLYSPSLRTPWPSEPREATCRASPLGRGYFTGVADGRRVMVENREEDPCECGRVHRYVSTTTDDGCRPIAYPLEFAEEQWGHGAWTPAVVEAVDYGLVHRVPSPTCSCGWYALHRLPEESSRRAGLVWGIVGGWGRLEATRDGWRAQWATLLGLLGDGQLQALADVPVSPDPSELEAIVPAARLPASLLPDPR